MTQQIFEPFKLVCEISKAYEHFDLVAQQSPKKRIVGMASGIKLDREEERMARSVIEQFQNTITEGIILEDGQWSLVPLISAHRKTALGEPEWDQILGYIIKAWVDEQWNLWIEAELDPDNPQAMMLFQKLTRQPEEGRPVKLGLSVGGIVLEATKEFDSVLGKDIIIYQSIALREVSVTSAPAYPTEYLQALSKSVNWEKLQSTEETLMENIDETVTTEVEQVATDIDVEKADQTAEVEAEVTKEQVEQTDASEAAVEAEVEKAAEDADETAEAEVEKAEDVDEVEFVTLEAFNELRSTVEQVAKQLGELAKAIAPAEEAAEEAEKSVEADEEVEADPQVEAAVEVEAAQDDVVERSVQEDAPIDVDAIVNKTVETMTTRFEGVLEKAVSPLLKRIEELENEEVDKSISVTRASEVTGKLLRDDQDSEFVERLGTLKGRDALAAAVFGE